MCTIRFYLAKIAGTVLFWGFGICVFSQSHPLFTPEQMRNDVDSLIAYIEDAHPDPYYRYPKKQFYRDARQLRQSFNRPLDIIGFYLAVQPLVTRLEDGHTDLEIPMELYNAGNPFVFPYEVRLSDRAPYIVAVRTYRGLKAELPRETKIRAINGIPAKKIVADIIRMNSGESEKFRAEFGANYFDFYLETLYATNGTYDVEYTENGQAGTLRVKGEKLDVLQALWQQPDTTRKTAPVTDAYYSLKLFPQGEPSAALIDFTSFEDLEAFERFADSAFAILQKKNIRHLIIDLRQNGGGDSDIGDAFFQYLAQKPFRQYDCVFKKHSRLLKERLLRHRKDHDRALDSSDLAQLRTPNGTFDTLRYNDIPLRENPLRFHGNVYLLVSTYTFSSAADFVQCFKHYRMGTVIGEETGGLIVSYGDIVSARLPNTGQPLTVSSKLYLNIGAHPNDWKGVRPDLEVPASKAMEEALRLIRKTP